MGHPFAVTINETLAANRTITAAEAASSNVFAFDCGGSARTLTLPAEATSTGYVFFISNTSDAAEILTIADDAAGTVCTPTQNEDAVVWCDGVAWRGGTLAAV